VEEDHGPILSVRNLRVTFGPGPALDDVSLELHRGTTLALVGESGCGKSVTCRAFLNIIQRPGRIVSGEVEPRAGRVGEVQVHPGEGGAHVVHQRPQLLVPPLAERPDHRGRLRGVEGGQRGGQVAVEALQQGIGHLALVEVAVGRVREPGFELDASCRNDRG